MSEFNLTPTYNIVRYTADGISGVAIVASIMGYLPGIAALAGIIWYGVQIWESKTVQKRIRVWRNRRRLKRLVVLQSKVTATKEKIQDAQS